MKIQALSKLSCCLLSTVLITNPVVAAECDAYFVSEQYKADQSVIKFWHFNNQQWGESREVYRSDEKWNFSPTLSLDQAGNIIFFWMAADKNEFQIYSRALSSKGDWLSSVQKVSNTPGQKSAPKLFLSLDKTLYAAWLSDASGNDEIQLVTIDNNLNVKKIEGLYEENNVPDIDPSFEYQTNGEAELDLIFSWRQLSKEQFSYIDKSSVLQSDKLNQSSQSLSDTCEEKLRDIDLPENLSSGTLYIPTKYSQPYSYFQQR